MRTLCTIITILALAFATMARAEFNPWEHYEPSDAVWSVTTVKVAANMGDVYLEGLANSWVPGMALSKKLGQIEDFKIYRSDLPASGDFNLLLIVKFANSDAMAPNKARYDAFMKEFTKEKSDEATGYAQKNYPGIREITGDYIFREIKLK